MTSTHPMLATATHDEASEQFFIRDLKSYLGEEIEPFQRRIAERLDPGEGHNRRVAALFERLHEQDAFRAWASVRRTAQEQLWSVVSASVERQSETLNDLARQAPALGSLTLDPSFRTPAYLAEHDVHLMPGGYQADGGDSEVSQGAIMDRGGAVYMLGRNGGLMNDVRGHTLAAHLFARFPNFAPSTILELGCGVGASAVPVARYFPHARFYAIDVGASVLRYAHARSAWLGADIHFVQGDAEHVPFADESVDLVFSCVLMHETSAEAIPAIMAECLRVLKPGGIVVHLEVPQRYDSMDLWGKIRGEVERVYNNEPCWQVAISTEYDAVLRAIGFEEVAVGYQSATPHAVPGAGGFSDTSQGVFRSWFVVSGRKPS